MIYDGNFINRLQEIAFKVVHSQICGKCGQTLGRHSFIGDNCPSNSPYSLYLDSTFSDDLEAWYARCEANNV